MKKGEVAWNKGKKMSPETCRKMSLSRMGHPGYTKGLKLSAETRLKMSLAQKGRPKSPEHIRAVVEANRGFRHSEESKRKISLIQQGKRRGGKTELLEFLRKSFKYEEWRMKVYRRDGFTCQECGASGVPIDAHHKNRYVDLVREALVCLPLLTEYEACLSFDPLWDISNGITLCKNCHMKTRSVKK